MITADARVRRIRACLHQVQERMARRAGTQVEALLREVSMERGDARQYLVGEIEWNWRFGFVLKSEKITPCFYVGRKYPACRNILILISNKFI